MGWFGEQIRDRVKADNEAFEDSFMSMAGAVMGRKLSAALNDARQSATDAVGQILRYYHIKPGEVPDNITDIEETLEFLLRPHGIMRRNVTLDDGWYKDATGAMIGMLKESGAPVALVPSGLSSYRFTDPATGRSVKINRKTAKLLDREAIAFYKPFPPKKIGIPGLIKFIFDNIRPSDIVLIVMSMITVTLVGFISPALNRMLFSDVIVSGSYGALVAIAVFIICVSISSLLLGTVKNMLMTRLTTRLNLSVEAATMMRVLSLPAGFFKEYSSGDLASRSQYIKSLVNMLLGMMLSTGLSSLFSLAYISQIFAYAPALVVPSLIIIIATVVVSVLSSLLQMRVSKQQMEISAKESGMSYAVISGIQKIRLSGSEKRVFARWAKLYSRSARLTYDPPMILKVNSVITTAISLIGTIVIYFASAKSGISAAEYYAFNTAYAMVSGAFMSVAGIALSVANIKPVLEMAAPVLDTEPEISENKRVISGLRGGIELSNVTFTYDEGMPNVLDGLSLKIRPGQYVAIVGKTGCGKSTLMRILLGFEKPQKGAVYYDGVDLSRIDLKSLRRKIGTVMQNGKIFSGDIYSNIIITNPRLTVDEAWEAAEMAGMADDIRRMPMGMHTILSEGQGGISGGQRQRLLIARAIAPKPKVLMFDEATSALDNITQKTVSDSLDKLKCTRIVIAHRLSTIKNCDRIIVLDKGHIIEDGTYEELIAQNGFFAELVERQRVDISNGPAKEKTE